MSDFSKSPLELLIANQQKGYVGIHIEQGVPLLDRDLNLLHDLVAATVRSVITRYIGSGLAAGADGFAIQPIQPNPSSTDFVIAKGAGSVGTCLVSGVEVTIMADATYTNQPQANLDQAKRDGLNPPAPLTPPAADRLDTVYLDVWLSEVDATSDPDLSNNLDVGMETAVRVKPFWLVRVAEGAPLPTPPQGHAFYPLALLNRKAASPPIDAAAIQDQRQGRLTMSDMERRLALVEKLLVLPAFADKSGTQFLPKRGFINQVVTLYGANFDLSPVEVTIGGLVAPIVGTLQPEQIQIQVPGGLTPAGTAADLPITVTTAGGQATSDQLLHVLAGPAFAPPGGQFSPTSGTPGTTVTLNGFNFNAGTPKVLFGAVAATNSGQPAATHMDVIVPAGVVAGGGGNSAVQITVTITGANGVVVGTSTSDDQFTVQAPQAPFAWGSPPFAPLRGFPGDPLSLNINNAPPGSTRVTFNATNPVANVSLPVVIPPNATKLDITIPPQLPTGSILGGGVKYTIAIDIQGTAQPAPIQFTALPHIG
jgi:hypothetical protein